MISTSDKVVCVNPHGLPPGADLLAMGEVYVVLSIVREIQDGHYVTGLKLVGMNAGAWPKKLWRIIPIKGDERSYNADRFRKLADIKAENTARRAESSLQNTPDQTRRDK